MDLLALLLAGGAGLVGGAMNALAGGGTFATLPALAGSALLVLTPTETFDVIVPWLLLFAFTMMVFGKRAAGWLHARVTIGRGPLLATQSLLGVYGGYFGGGVGLITTALYGLLANIQPRELFAIRTTMLAVANLAAALVFMAFGMVRWWFCLPVMAGAILGGWLGARFGKTLSPRAVRAWTLLLTGGTTAAFFARAYA